MKRIKLKGGEEFDAFTGWRKYLRWKAGQLKSIKQAYNRRFRRLSRKLLKGSCDE